MDNNDNLLQAFGGEDIHNLKNILHHPDDTSEEISIFTYSPYFDLDSISKIKLPKSRTFNVLSINIQSIHAKFDSLTAFLEIASQKDLIFDAILLQESWLSEAFVKEKNNIAIFITLYHKERYAVVMVD